MPLAKPEILSPVCARRRAQRGDCVLLKDVRAVRWQELPPALRGNGASDDNGDVHLGKHMLCATWLTV